LATSRSVVEFAGAPIGYHFQRSFAMATYILLGTFTDQGIRNIKDTAKRAEAIRAMAKKMGITVKDFYWTLGQYDVAAVFEAPDEAAMTSLALAIGALGNVRTQLLRSFTEKEIGPIVSKATKRK
jgi:uncharacterized protein with GYD domain